VYVRAHTRTRTFTSALLPDTEEVEKDAADAEVRTHTATHTATHAATHAATHLVVGSPNDIDELEINAAVAKIRHAHCSARATHTATQIATHAATNLIIGSPDDIDELKIDAAVAEICF